MSINEIIMSLEIGFIYGIVAIGVYLAFKVIDFPDMTCDGSFVLGAAVSTVMIKFGYNPLLALLLSMAIGALAGMITGIINTCFKVTELLSGVLVAFMLYSVNLRIMGGIPNIALIDPKTIFIANIPALIILLIISAIICILLNYLLTTDFGLALRSIGQNKKLAQFSGININTMVIVGLALSNGFIAFGGALFSQHQEFTDINGGIGTIIIGFASVMIGERILPYRSIITQLLSCLLGSILYRLIISFALHSEILGLEAQDLNLITGLLVISIMFMRRRKTC